MKENPESELTRLRKEQRKTLQDEVFGGLSPAETAAYNARADRIHALENEIQSSAAAADRRRQSNKNAETDTPQSEAHQPYRSREKDSANAFTDSLRTNRGKRKNDSAEKDNE